MSSTGKTETLGLNQWARTDAVRMDDFNADNAKIEAALTSLLPIRRIRTVTVSQDTLTMEVDLSDINMNDYSQIWIDFRLGVDWTAKKDMYLRLNNIATDSYKCAYISSNQFWPTTYNYMYLYTGLYRVSLGAAVSWLIPTYIPYGEVASTALTPANWTSITCYRTGVLPIPAGGTVKIYGVVK